MKSAAELSTAVYQEPAGQRIAFTVKYPDRCFELFRTHKQDRSGPYFSKGDATKQGKTYTAIYDTGATRSVVSPRVVEEFQLPAIGESLGICGPAGATMETGVHLASFRLPSELILPVRVVRSEISPGIDAPIGMDILSAGDFRMRLVDGKTVSSFVVLVPR
jgi:hypothetical protein